jgi:hypothetical protein
MAKRVASLSGKPAREPAWSAGPCTLCPQITIWNFRRPTFGSPEDPRSIFHGRPSIRCFSRPHVRLAQGWLVSLLTGANSDGAAGFVRIKAQGGLTFVQRRDEASYPTMPLSGLQEAAPQMVSIHALPSLLMALANERNYHGRTTNDPLFSVGKGIHQFTEPDHLQKLYTAGAGIRSMMAIHIHCRQLRRPMKIWGSHSLFEDYEGCRTQVARQFRRHNMHPAPRSRIPL